MKTSDEKMPYFSAYPLKEAVGPSGNDLSQSFLRIADTAKKIIRVRVLPMSLPDIKKLTDLQQSDKSSGEGSDDKDKDWFKSYE